MGSQICKYFGSCFYPLEGTLTSPDNTGQFSVFTVGTPQYFSIQTASLWFGMIGHCKYCLCSLSILSIWTQEHNRRQASHGSFPFSIFIHHGLFHFSTHQQTKEPFWNILVLIERKGKKNLANYHLARDMSSHLPLSKLKVFWYMCSRS